MIHDMASITVKCVRQKLDGFIHEVLPAEPNWQQALFNKGFGCDAISAQLCFAHPTTPVKCSSIKLLDCPHFKLLDWLVFRVAQSQTFSP